MNSYDLFLFDLDGTIINTEELHCLAYNTAFHILNIPLELDYKTYCKYAHHDENSLENVISSISDISYEKIYEIKREKYRELINTNLNFISGADIFLEQLLENNKNVCIVTNTDSLTINILKTKLPLLNKIQHYFTGSDCINRKPSPELYLKAINKFCPKNPIGFEDSYKGFMALNKTSITSVFVGSDYYYLNKIKPENVIQDYNNINWSQIKTKSNNFNNYVDISINRYENAISLCKNNFSYILQQIIPLLKHNNSQNSNIYLTGIGKCGHICKKSVSTWQSVGISCHYINIPDLFHGDFGILKNKDIIIYISNSGNTEELINCAKYIKSKFIKVTQIALTIKNNSKIQEYVNFYYNLTNNHQDILELDSINMAPTVSSVLFLMFLDMLGIYIAESNNLTIEKFKLNHPGGDLGKVNNNIIDYVVIVASGLGTRLHPVTKYIPKILVDFNNKPFVTSLIEYWQNYCNKIIIISNSQYNELITYYTSNYNNIKIINFDTYTGTADTINKTITQEYYHKNILFTWCDILPKNKLDLSKLDSNIIFTYGNQCRFGIEQNKVVKKENGNIIGLYYIKDYTGVHNYNVGDDVCDVFMNNNFIDFKEYILEDLIDIGDLEKYRKFLNNNNSFKTRFFNEITNNNNILTKRSLNDQGDEIITKEINWYKRVNKYNLDFVPEIYSFNHKSFTMKYLDAKPIYLLFNNFSNKKKLEIINNILEKLNKLHELENLENTNYDKDIFIEGYEKIYTRLAKVINIINYFGNITKVNNQEIRKLDYVIDYCFNIIKNNNNTNYSIIHGDCQFSNTLLSKENKIYFIDPRGYFGQTKIYGSRYYDYGKVLYALSGYDSFNNNEEYSISNLTKDNIDLEIHNNLDLLRQLPEKLNNDITKALVIINWLSLAQYNSNNVLKCISSYYYGLYLFNMFFE
jgi:D-arabinose 5-phosphate isomerase GutQ/beta-phosphoglucomutase-like phosphatase (HAD superfamily)/GTP:adenosylcobinamide-phosphate guanylyltransferase